MGMSQEELLSQETRKEMAGHLRTIARTVGMNDHIYENTAKRMESDSVRSIYDAQRVLKDIMIASIDRDWEDDHPAEIAIARLEQYKENLRKAADKEGPSSDIYVGHYETPPQADLELK